ncbi:hypothetical protein AQPE_2864 [Aquipluma nitroreducens]|uniref:Uncharacterized protein n=1 Tax=Aquipluma nitroreducens TaxID=2010828 RepID=A0A5K7SAV9_9BACT|nr:hypothetical protein [Aquipluma nitroreducens]BBE18700.1 hypothetical protein AQPE_2864 [Aquipluma nitroreducens]
MEQNYIEKQVKNQIQLIVRETNSEVNYSALRFQSKLKLSGIFIIPNKGKGPPGQTRSPGYFPKHPPDEVATPDRVSNPVRGKGHIFNSIHFFKTIKPNFLLQLNFLIMKKQFLFLTMFSVALIFAGTNKSYAQCADDALHPMAGKDYHYVITTAGGGTAKSYEWIVTTSTDIVKTGTFATTIAPGPTTYTITNAGTADATINWSPTVIAAAMAATPTDYYVAVKYVATSAADGCDVDNVKAYKINPVNMFQIDLANVKSDGSAGTGNNCTSTVVDAKITAGATPTITYDYGTSSVYVKVTAKNFSGSWDMTVGSGLLAALNAAESGKLYWSPTIGGTEIEVTPGTAITIPEKTIDPTDAEDIYLRLEVDHNTWEGLTAEAFPFAVDGKDKAGNDDVSATCAADADIVTQTILERPTITNGTVVGGFIMP